MNATTHKTYAPFNAKLASGKVLLVADSKSPAKPSTTESSTNDTFKQFTIPAPDTNPKIATAQTNTAKNNAEQARNESSPRLSRRNQPVFVGPREPAER